MRQVFGRLFSADYHWHPGAGRKYGPTRPPKREKALVSPPARVHVSLPPEMFAKNGDYATSAIPGFIAPPQPNNHRVPFARSPDADPCLFAAILLPARDASIKDGH